MWIIAFAAALVGLVLLQVIAARRWLRIIVTGNSMAPTFRDGQRLLVRRRTREPRVGDAIVFDAPPERRGEVALRLKRVAAVAGDVMPAWARERFRGAIVPAGYLLVAGDNAISEDSRQLGLVAVTAVHAIVDEPRHSTSRGNVARAT